MKEYIKSYSNKSIVLSIISMIFSLLLIFKPNFLLTFATTVLGGIILTFGIINIISFFRIKNEYKAFSLELLQGVAMIVIGIILMLKTDVIKLLIGSLIGIWMIVQSIMKLQCIMSLKDIADNKYYYIMLIFQILMIIVGIIMIINPFATIEVLIMACGISLLINEIINLIETITILRLIK